MTAFSTEKNKSSESFILYCPLFAVTLQKISCGIIFATLFQRNKDSLDFY